MIDGNGEGRVLIQQQHPHAADRVARIDPALVINPRVKMINLRKSLAVWGTPAFEARLRAEIEELDAGLLPLQQALSQGSYVTDAKFRAMLISAAEETAFLRGETGDFL